MRCEGAVMAMERKCGWDTLLCPDTQQYAVGLLARIMRRSSIPLCSGIALYLLRLLSMEIPFWDFAALAFIAEVLECLDVTEYEASLLEIMTKNLQSECRERRHLALRGLMVLGPTNPPMENNSFVVRMTIVVLRYLFLNHGGPIQTPIALQLAEALLPLFDSDDSQVQLSSMTAFQEMMDLLKKKQRKALKPHVRQSLFPLALHCHDDNPHVAEASREALHYSARLLKRKDIEQMLQVDKTWRFGKGLVASTPDFRMAEKRQGLSEVNRNKSSSASAKQANVARQSKDGKKQTEEQDPGQGRFHRTLQKLKDMWRGKTTKDTEVEDKSDSTPTDASTESIEMTNYVVKADQVPAMVRIMHQKLQSPATADVRLFMNILRMAEEHPANVVLTLLRCAPTCDRIDQKQVVMFFTHDLKCPHKHGQDCAVEYQAKFSKAGINGCRAGKYDLALKFSVADGVKIWDSGELVCIPVFWIMSCPVLVPPMHEGRGTVPSSPEEAMELIRELEHLPYGDRRRKLGLFSLEKVDVWKKFFPMRAWHGLLREAVAAPSVEVSKGRLDGTWSNQAWWKPSLRTAGEELV
ncbi:hypothetical protein TURU_133477 [Turdus rufiventris]|nr:hypothetical protein TURU_133477 [Turdus rufiventris]